MNPSPEQQKQAQQLREAADIIEQGLEFEYKSNACPGLWCQTGLASTPLDWMNRGHEIRRKPWTLGRSINGHTLGEGQEWHRQDFTQEMLPAGWRPFLLGEQERPGDEWLKDGDWKVITNDNPSVRGTRADDSHLRTTHPLPPVAPLKWAAEREAFKRDETIEWKLNNDSIGWKLVEGTPAWEAHGIMFRVKPTPILVQLCKDDVPPCSMIQFPDCGPRMVSVVHEEGLTHTQAPDLLLTFEDLMNGGCMINRSIPESGRWDKTAWKPCSKPAP